MKTFSFFKGIVVPGIGVNDYAGGLVVILGNNIGNGLRRVLLDRKHSPKVDAGRFYDAYFHKPPNSERCFLMAPEKETRRIIVRVKSAANPPKQGLGKGYWMSRNGEPHFFAVGEGTERVGSTDHVWKDGLTTMDSGDALEVVLLDGRRFMLFYHPVSGLRSDECSASDPRVAPPVVPRS
jgi:hypothetical protein